MQKIVFLLSVLLGANFSYSAIIMKTKSNKCLIHLEGQDAFPEDKFFVLNLVGEKVGIVTIEKAKNGKAIGRIDQGIAEANWILEKTSQANPTLDVIKTQTTFSSSLRNSIGVSLTGNYSRLIKSITRGSSPMEYFNSFSGGGSFFTNFKLSSSLMLHLQAGGDFIQLRENSNNRSSIGIRNFNQDRRSSFLVWSVPVTLQYFLPMDYPNAKIWIGFGIGVNYWGTEFEQTYDILDRELTFNKLSNSGHLTLGVDYYPSQTPFFIPIRFQGTSHFILDFIQRSVFGNERTELTLNQLSLYIGIAQHI